MKGILFSGALAVSATQAAAGGLDATGQSVAFLFSEGTVAELSFAHVSPNISGSDLLPVAGSPTGNIASAINLPSFSFKHDVTE